LFLITACFAFVVGVCESTGSMCSSLGGAAAGGETGAAVTTGANDVIAGCKKINAAAEVSATCTL